jgi:hypothetical protein
LALFLLFHYAFGPASVGLTVFSGVPTVSNLAVVAFHTIRSATVPVFSDFFAGLWTVWLMDNARLVHAQFCAVREAIYAAIY